MPQIKQAGRSEDVGSAAGKNLSLTMIPENEEASMFGLKSNSGEKASQSKRPGRLIEDSAYDDESYAIDVRDTVAKYGGSTTRKNPPQIIIPANEEKIVP